MGLEMNKIQEFRKEGQTGGRRLIRERPTVVLTCKDSPKIAVQGGQAYGMGGDLIPTEELPAWFWDQYRLMRPERQKLFGLKPPELPKAQEVKPMPFQARRKPGRPSNAEIAARKAAEERSAAEQEKEQSDGESGNDGS